MKNIKYKSIKKLEKEIGKFRPKNVIDYILNGSQLNGWFKSLRDKDL